MNPGDSRSPVADIKVTVDEAAVSATDEEELTESERHPRLLPKAYVSTSAFWLASCSKRCHVSAPLPRGRISSPRRGAAQGNMDLRSTRPSLYYVACKRHKKKAATPSSDHVHSRSLGLIRRLVRSSIGQWICIVLRAKHGVQ